MKSNETKRDSGVLIICPVCKTKPPSKLKGGARWKWMCFHLDTHIVNKTKGK